MAGHDEELTRRLAEALSQPMPPAAEADHILRIHNFMEGLPDASGTFGGHLVTGACYEPGGCEPGCPVLLSDN